MVTAKFDFHQVIFIISEGSNKIEFRPLLFGRKVLYLWNLELF